MRKGGMSLHQSTARVAAVRANPLAQPDPTQHDGIGPSISFWPKSRPAISSRLAQTLTQGGIVIDGNSSYK